MARKGQIAIQDNIDTNEEFDNYLVAHANQLICMEVYSEFCGSCAAASNALRKGKLEIGQDRIAMGRALSDNIDALRRFKDKSEPVFLFIVPSLSSTILEERNPVPVIIKSNVWSQKSKLLRVMFGSNGVELCHIIEEELAHMKREVDTGVLRPRMEIHEMLPEESEKIKENLKLEEEYREASERLRVLTLAARKRRVCERLSKNVAHLNYIMFWPHCHHAHKDLYEKWDTVNITVGAKEMLQLDENSVKEALYMSDVDPNEACLHALMNGEVMVVLFKMFDTDDRDFVKILRHALYEEIPIPKEDIPPEEQPPLVTAYERYGSISKPARVIRRERYNVKMAKLRQEQEENERLAAERARLAKEAEAEAETQKDLPEEETPKVTEVVEGEEATVEPEEMVEAEEEFHSDVEEEGEDYIPPAGLFVPGLYAPPNELAKANGLAFFFPKIVETHGRIESEHLPPHMLVIFPIEKRHDVQAVIKAYPGDILATGVFMGDDPFAAEHVAYSIKQYDQLDRPRKHKDKVALMVSRRRSLALLQLAALNPCYISSDTASGEKECLQLFPVGYGDEYEEELSVEEEEIEEVQPEPEPEHQPEEVEVAPKNEDDDEDED